MLISELSERTGASTRALRHYDQRGLLPSARLANGYRDFPAEAVEVVRRIRHCLDAGLDLGEVGELLPCFTDEGGPRPCENAVQLLADRIQAVDASMVALREARSKLATALTYWS